MKSRQDGRAPLISGYEKHMSWSQCRAKEGCLQCMARLDADISDALPYLNTALGGFLFVKEPPSVSFMHRERIVVVFPDRIGITNVNDENEADEILEWFISRINEAWEGRCAIEPSEESGRRANVVEILKILGPSSYSECDESSCLALAVRLSQGLKRPDDCPSLPADKREALDDYLGFREAA